MRKSADSSKTASVFIDTSAHLGCTAFDEVDWLTLLNAESVTIIVLPIIMGELDDKKDSHPNQRIRNRAKSIGRKFHDFFETDFEATVRDGVTIKYDATEPKIDFGANSLNPDRQDDKQLAGIITFKNDHPDERVILIAQDFNLRTRARTFGIEAPRIPLDLELGDEPDPNEKTIRELQQKVLELEKQFPVLKLRFKDGSDRASFTLKRFAGLSQDEVNQMLEQIRQKFPKMPIKPHDPSDQPKVNSPRGGVEVSELAKLFEADIFGYTEVDKRNYNEKLDGFFAAYEDYVKRHSDYVCKDSLTVDFELELANDGTAPAEDVDIDLHFPDGFELRDEVLDEPRKPKPPAQPLTTLAKLGQDPFRGLSIGPYIPHPTPVISNAPPPNVSGPNIRRTKSYDVRFKVRKIKHNIPISFDRLYITFDSFETARSFGIEYRINAGNMPRDAKNFINVIINKEEEPA